MTGPARQAKEAESGGGTADARHAPRRESG